MAARMPEVYYAAAGGETRGLAFRAPYPQIAFRAMNIGAVTIQRFVVSLALWLASAVPPAAAVEPSLTELLARCWLGDGRQLPVQATGREPRRIEQASEIRARFDAALRWWVGDGSHLPSR